MDNEKGVSASDRPNSMEKARRYVASLAASLAAMISDSHNDKATQGCVFDDQVMAARLYWNTEPYVECRTAQIGI